MLTLTPPLPHPIFNSTQTDGSHAISTISKGIRKHIAMSIQCPRIITPHMEDDLFVFGKVGKKEIRLAKVDTGSADADASQVSLNK